MRVVLGLSLTASSAVWVLVDTYDGRIIADEVVPLESVNEIARAAARSVQAFALHSDEDIDGVRLVWDDEARQDGIRLRTKLRLFGFETIDTVSEEAAREGRNRTARHIAPHLVLAYGAARADLDDTDDKGVLRRLVAKVPHRVPAGIPAGISLRLTAAASVAAIAVIGLTLYAFVGRSPAPDVVDTTVAEAVVPAPPAGVAPFVPQPAPQAIVAPQPAVPQAVEVQEPTVAEALPEVAQVPEYATEPVVVGDDVYDTAVPQVAEVPDTTTVAETPATVGLGSTVPEQFPTAIEAPHLTGVGPAAGPVGAPAQATPASVAPVAPAPAGPLGALFSALP